MLKKFEKPTKKSKSHSEDIEEEMELGEKEEEVYSEEGREKLIEGDEIENWEEGFMEGAEGKGHRNSCSYCGKNLEEEVFEREFDGKMRWFCSEEHAQRYADKIKKEKKR